MFQLKKKKKAGNFIKRGALNDLFYLRGHVLLFSFWLFGMGLICGEFLCI